MRRHSCFTKFKTGARAHAEIVPVCLETPCKTRKGRVAGCDDIGIEMQKGYLDVPLLAIPGDTLYPVCGAYRKYGT